MAEATLFFSAFLAATILPFSSEVAFMGAISYGMSVSHALFFASTGNILAIIFNYGLGYLLSHPTKIKLQNSKMGRISLAYGKKYALLSLFFSWLPLIGDPLTVVAGIMRLEFLWFVAIAGTLRIARYYFLSQIF